MPRTPLWLFAIGLLAAGRGATDLEGLTPAAQSAADADSTQSRWLRPDTVLRPPGGIPLVLKASPTAGISTIRVFIPLDESFAEAGTGRVLARLAAGRVAGAAARVGARFTSLRTPSGIAYSVTGSDEDFDYLAYVLRRAIGEPSEQEVVVRRLAARVRTGLERSNETGRGWVVADLMGHLCPTLAPETGLAPALSSLSPERVRRFWRRTHLTANASVIVVSRAPRSVVLSALRTLDLPDTGGATPETEVAPTSSHVPLQVLRRWYGEARPLPRDAVAHTRVLAELLTRSIDASRADHELFVELRRARCSEALLVVGTSYRSGERSMRAAVSGLVGEVTTSLTEEAVRWAVQDVRGGLVREVANPAGLAAALGREGVDLGEPDGLSRLHAQLIGIDVDAMAAYLDRVASLAPLRSELQP